MNSGYEEQFAFNNLEKNIRSVKEHLSSLKEETNMTNISGKGSTNASVRVRNNIPNVNPIVVPTIRREEPKEFNNYYNSVPTYSINPSQTKEAAFAAVLMVMEILALIILVTLITLVAFYGLS